MVYKITVRSRNLPKHPQQKILCGFEIDEAIMSIASINLLMHGIGEAGLYRENALGPLLLERHPDQHSNYFDLVLLNPPFRSNIDSELIDPSLKDKISTKDSLPLLCS